MERVGCWVGFAGLAGAAEEVQGEELHFPGDLNFFSVVSGEDELTEARFVVVVLGCSVTHFLSRNFA